MNGKGAKTLAAPFACFAWSESVRMPPAIWVIDFAFPAANHEAPMSDSVGHDTKCTLHPIVSLFEDTACIPPPIGTNHSLNPSPTLEDGGDGGSSQRESRTCRERRDR